MQYKVIDLVYHNMEALIGSKIGFPDFTQMIILFSGSWSSIVLFKI